MSTAEEKLVFAPTKILLIASILAFSWLQDPCIALQPFDLKASKLPSNFPSTQNGIETSVVVASDVGRLLLEPPSSLPRNVMKEIERQRALEDNRLTQCQDTGSNWEQCFFYGTNNAKVDLHKASSSSTPPTNSPRPSLDLPQPFPSQTTTKNKIPTW